MKTKPLWEFERSDVNRRVLKGALESKKLHLKGGYLSRLNRSLDLRTCSMTSLVLRTSHYNKLGA